MSSKSMEGKTPVLPFIVVSFRQREEEIGEERREGIGDKCKRLSVYLAIKGGIKGINAHSQKWKLGVWVFDVSDESGRGRWFHVRTHTWCVDIFIDTI